jgi:hypothetical protein
VAPRDLHWQHRDNADLHKDAIYSVPELHDRHCENRQVGQAETNSEL